MRLFQQVGHGGHIYPVLDQSPPWGVSTVPNPATGIVPNPMGIAEIEEVIAAFAASARRCREGGTDGIEIPASHGSPLMQFPSPPTNTRADRIGGSLATRMQFLLAIMMAVRDAVGPHYDVGSQEG